MPFDSRLPARLENAGRITSFEAAEASIPLIGTVRRILRAARRSDVVALASIVLAGAVVRLWGIHFGLPHTQARPDETQVMDVALAYLRGDMWPAFYDYPRLYNYALVLLYLTYFAVGYVAGWFGSLAGMLASWPVHWEPFFLINRGLSAACGTLAIPVVYAIGRDLAGRAAGLAAAMFMAFAFLHVRDSHYGTTDAAMTLFIVLSVGELLKSDLRGWNRHDASAAVAAGLASGTKYNGVVLLVPIALSQLLQVLADRSGRLRRVAGGRAAGMAAAFAVAFLLCVPFVLFDHARYAAAMNALGGSMWRGDGVVPSSNGWWYHLSVSLRHGLGTPLLIAGLAGLPLLLWSGRRTGLLFLAFPLAYFGVAGAINNLFVRYAIPVVPFMCVSAGVCAVWLARTVSRGHRKAEQAALAVLVLALVAPSARKVAAFDILMSRTDNRVVVADWLARNAPRGSSVLQSGSIYGYVQLPPELGLESWTWDKRERAFTYLRKPVVGRPDFILLQESPVPSTTQPAVRELLGSGYHLVSSHRAYDPKVADNVYDMQDAFYLPYGRFRKVLRPGPNFLVYQRFAGGDDEGHGR